jgi:hypothetical protein
MQAQLGTVHAHDPWKVRRAAITCHRTDCRHSNHVPSAKIQQKKKNGDADEGQDEEAGRLGLPSLPALEPPSPLLHSPALFHDVRHGANHSVVNSAHSDTCTEPCTEKGGSS